MTNSSGIFNMCSTCGEILVVSVGGKQQQCRGSVTTELNHLDSIPECLEEAIAQKN